ncbi:DUF2652 domain-containing protein [Flavobacteriaceae bacterium KMM 6898]|nr:DUF2652 domain-containing protein [Flavobacteriaceae bacterium KMM 6898]
MGTSHKIQSALFFIPDISGYTKFINETEINHSTHIITELLEIIISSNNLDLIVSEIEGDAVFFYKLGENVSIEEIIKQAENMFINFHQHLKFYASDRICQCGACSTAHQLTLKFVCHFGETTIRNIGKHVKLFGPDVTLAHRLLKNNVLGEDYLLITSNPKFSDKSQLPDWIELRKSVNNYKGIGMVSYNYFSLTPLKSRLVELSEQTIIKQFERPVSSSVVMKTALKKLHGIVTNFSLRPKWIFGLLYIKKPTGHLSTIGTKHLCIMPTTKMEFTITSQKLDEGEIQYVEQSNNIKWLAPLNIIFTMTRISEKKTKLSISINYKRNKLSGLYLDFPLRMMMYMVARISLLKLNNYMKHLPS